MLRKTLSAPPKKSCDRQSSVACFHAKNNEKVFGKPKKVVASKKPHVIASAASQDGKCSSTGKISNKTRSSSAKHVTRSDLTFFRKPSKKVIFDHCLTCGDTGLTNTNISDREDEDFFDSFSNVSTLVRKSGKEKLKTEKTKTTVTKKPKSLEQFYKNENFKNNSGHEMKNATKKESELLPIKELPEVVKDSSDFYLESEKTSVEDKIRMAIESDREVSLKQLKEFREKNYFECHSSASRVTRKSDVTSLKDHKCRYRFYLNDRLFPVPLNSDYNNNIRCTDCQLPYEGSRSHKENVLNGTIQAKIKLGVEEETQDITLLLPVQEPLIIREKRAEKSKPKNDMIYFGVVRLTASGHSIFNRNLPEDSLALKYQRGYKEFVGSERCAYDSIDTGDVIFI